VTTTAALDSLVCNASSTLTDRINNTLAGIEIYGAYNFNEAVGIALNGVPIKAGVNASGYDVIYPKPKGREIVSRVDLDACLGTTTASMTGLAQLNGEEDTDEDGVYHYHTMSPCLY